MSLHAKKSMTRDEMLAQLTRWAERVAEVQAADRLLQELTGRSPEGRLTSVMWATVAAYGDTLEQLLIGNAESKWLEWHLWENEMGQRGHTVETDTGERPIDSLEALADLLMECRA